MTKFTTVQIVSLCQGRRRLLNNEWLHFHFVAMLVSEQALMRYIVHPKICTIFMIFCRCDLVYQISLNYHHPFVPTHSSSKVSMQRCDKLCLISCILKSRLFFKCHCLWHHKAQCPLRITYFASLKARYVTVLKSREQQGQKVNASSEPNMQLLSTFQIVHEYSVKCYSFQSSVLNTLRNYSVHIRISLSISLCIVRLSTLRNYTVYIRISMSITLCIVHFKHVT